MRKRRFLSLILAACMAASLVACGGNGGEETAAEIQMLSVASKGEIVNLKTSGLTNPVGLDDEAPTFSWQMQSDVVGAAQKAYRIVVKDDEGKNVWDSGKMESRECAGIVYEGEKLQPAMRYTWSVEVTDTGDETLSSGEAFFETGLMSSSFDAWDDAKWIGADELQLDAAYACVYQISAGVQVQQGDTASFIIGADDFRLKNSNFNINLNQ